MNELSSLAGPRGFTANTAPRQAGVRSVTIRALPQSEVLRPRTWGLSMNWDEVDDLSNMVGRVPGVFVLILGTRNIVRRSRCDSYSGDILNVTNLHPLVVHRDSGGG